MSTPTHILIGITLAHTGMQLGLLPDAPHLMYPLGILATNAPDFDILFLGFKKNHRLSRFHFPSTWSFLLLATYLILEISNSSSLLPYFALIASGIFSHFLGDTFDSHTGILWLAPISSKAYSFLPKDPYIPNTLKSYLIAYMKHPLLFVELFVWIVCAGVLFFL